MSLTRERKQEIIEQHGASSGDSGSTSVQVALLTARIEYLSEHLKRNVKDHHSRRGLLIMVGKRKRLLAYLEKTQYEDYKALIQSLGLRR